MRVIFLDVDGVIKFGREEFVDHSIDPLPVIEWHQLYNLREVVEQTGAGLVLSSEHRKYEDTREELEEVLAAVDLAFPFSETPNFSGFHSDFENISKYRADEILAWLEKNPEVSKYAIIDDIELVGFGPAFFHTKADFYLPASLDISYLGLTDQMTARIINYLNRD